MKSALSSVRDNDPRALLKEFEMIKEDKADDEYDSRGPIKKVAKGVSLKTKHKVLIGKKPHKDYLNNSNQMTVDEYKRLLVNQFNPRA